MYHFGFPGWAWDWGWGWAASVGSVILLGIFLLPWFFFLLNLQGLLNRVDERNRAMPAGHVWLNFIPVFNLGWFIYTVSKVRDSVKAEYASRGWMAEGDLGYNVGLATGVLAIASFVIGWVPVLGWGVGIASVICWIIYWLKTSDLKGRLGEAQQWRPSAPYGQYPAQAPPSQPYGPPSGSTPPGVTPTGAAGGAAAGAAAAAGTTPPGTGSRPEPSGPAGSGPTRPTGSGRSSAGTADVAAPQPAAGSGKRQCAGCGSTYDAGDVFCRTCGLRLP